MQKKISIPHKTAESLKYKKHAWLMFNLHVLQVEIQLFHSKNKSRLIWGNALSGRVLSRHLSRQALHHEEPSNALPTTETVQGRPLCKQTRPCQTALRKGNKTLSVCLLRKALTPDNGLTASVKSLWLTGNGYRELFILLSPPLPPAQTALTLNHTFRHNQHKSDWFLAA